MVVPERVCWGPLIWCGGSLMILEMRAFPQNREISVHNDKTGDSCGSEIYLSSSSNLTSSMNFNFPCSPDTQ